MIQGQDILENVSMAEHTTMRVGGPADFFLHVRSPEAIREACDWASRHSISIFVLGEGSNIVVNSEGLRRFVIKIDIKGLAKVSETRDSLTMKIGAGEHWDSIVERAVRLNLSGIEAMSGIPGTAGAAPVQNAGAYGQEIADTLVELTAFDTVNGDFVTLATSDCEFGYRTSMFKTTQSGRYIICSITLRLSKKSPKRPTYESLKRYLDEHGIDQPDVGQIRQGVLSVRARILPDPETVPNSGSFFESPIVTKEKLREIEVTYPNVPAFTYREGYKIPAGWIVEQCGFKGQEHFGFRIWSHHALVITNPNGGTYSDLMRLVDLIVETVEQKFGLILEPEPLFAR